MLWGVIIWGLQSRHKAGSRVVVRPFAFSVVIAKLVAKETIKKKRYVGASRTHESINASQPPLSL